MEIQFYLKEKINPLRQERLKREVNKKTEQFQKFLSTSKLYTRKCAYNMIKYNVIYRTADLTN